MMKRTLKRTRRRSRRGLTLVELLLSLAVTAMIAAAIAAMMAAVSAGVSIRRDTRNIMLRGHALHVRLGAYFASALCVLDVDGDLLTLWLNDTRESDTVHASEIRWLQFDSNKGEYRMYYVRFPATWSEIDIAKADREYDKNSDWGVVLSQYTTAGLIESAAIVDGVSALDVKLSDNAAQQARIVSLDVLFDDAVDGAVFRSTQSIRFHRSPVQ